MVLGIRIVQLYVLTSPSHLHIESSPIPSLHTALSWINLRMDYTFEKKPELDKVKEGEEISEHGIRKKKNEKECDSSSSLPSLEEVSKPYLPVVSSFSQLVYIYSM